MPLLLNFVNSGPAAGKSWRVPLRAFLETRPMWVFLEELPCVGKPKGAGGAETGVLLLEGSSRQNPVM